jgi:hypothetical protein
MGVENLADDDRTIACGQFVQTSAYQRRRARLRGNAEGENATQDAVPQSFPSTHGAPPF